MQGSSAVVMSEMFYREKIVTVSQLSDRPTGLTATCRTLFAVRWQSRGTCNGRNISVCDNRLRGSEVS